jgi:Tol biopolymer transport system component
VWELKGASARKVHEQFSIAATAVMVPHDVQQAIRQYLESASMSTRIEQIQMHPFISELALSADKEHLAWIEGFDWTPDPQVSLSFDFTRLHLFDLERFTTESITLTSQTSPTDLSWSPTGRFLAYATRIPGSDGYIIGEVWLYDTWTEATVSLGEGFAPTWSSGGDRLAVYSSSSLDTHDSRLKVVPVLAPENALFIDYTWPGGLSSFSWGPTNDSLIGAGSMDPVYSIEKQELFTIHLDHNSVTGFAIQAAPRILDEPHWSPDGRMLAVEARPTYGDNPNALLVIDAHGEVVSQFALSDGYRQQWLWSRDSRSILRYLYRIAATKNDLQVLYPFNNHLEIVALPQEIAEGIENGLLYVARIAW